MKIIVLHYNLLYTILRNYIDITYILIDNKVLSFIIPFDGPTQTFEYNGYKIIIICVLIYIK